jgi:hypothetical protein
MPLWLCCVDRMALCIFIDIVSDSSLQKDGFWKMHITIMAISDGWIHDITTGTCDPSMSTHYRPTSMVRILSLDCDQGGNCNGNVTLFLKGAWGWPFGKMGRTEGSMWGAIAWDGARGATCCLAQDRSLSSPSCYAFYEHFQHCITRFYSYASEVDFKPHT